MSDANSDSPEQQIRILTREIVLAVFEKHGYEAGYIARHICNIHSRLQRAVSEWYWREYLPFEWTGGTGKTANATHFLQKYIKDLGRISKEVEEAYPKLDEHFGAPLRDLAKRAHRDLLIVSGRGEETKSPGLAHISRMDQTLPDGKKSHPILGDLANKIALVLEGKLKMPSVRGNNMQINTVTASLMEAVLPGKVFTARMVADAKRNRRGKNG